MTNAEVVQMFNTISDLLEIKGEDRYRVQAYRRAAQGVADYPGSVEALWREGKLEDIPGVGKILATKIDELLTTGTLDFYEKLRAEVPPSLIEVLRVPGVGPKRAQVLWKELGVTNLAELEAAAESGKLATLPGWGEKTAQNVLKGIQQARSLDDRVMLANALPIAQALVDALRQAPGVLDADMAGSLRRRKETVGDIDILCAAHDTAPVVAYFTQLPQADKVVSAGESKATILLHNGLTADLMVLPPESWGSLLQHFTGSKEHNIQLRSLAVADGLHISEYGITQNDILTRYADERDVYRALGMDWIPPELREGSGEIQAARAHKLPRLIELSDVRGDLQMHTTWSDGNSSVETMARAAMAQGWEWIAITDHSRGMGMTHGLDPDKARQQAEEIDAANRLLAPFRILKSVELEILPDGSMALPDDVLAEFDVVVAAAHIGQRGDRATLTRRYLNAIHNPHVDIIAHPFGRLIGRRPPMDLDFEAIVTACVETRTALEINGQPDRLDLDAPNARYAREQGVTLTLATDSHTPAGFSAMQYAVYQARRAWVGAADVVNTKPLAEFEAWLRLPKASRR
ncbi:MAG: DNA polymerase/3'-5' exonuclease PolX [Anaerolineae bacterium]